MGAVAEPGTRGDLRPLPRQVGVEAVDLVRAEAARVKLQAAERPGLRAQPVQPAGVRLDPALDDAAGLGQDRAARGQYLLRP